MYLIQENVLVDTFNISFESTQNKQEYGTQMTFTEVRKKFVVVKNVTIFRGIDLLKRKETRLYPCRSQPVLPFKILYTNVVLVLKSMGVPVEPQIHNNYD